MNISFVLIIFLFLVILYVIFNNNNKYLQKFINFKVLSNKKNCNASVIAKKQCQLSKNTNTYKCFLNQCDLCPMSSYKQCTNNYPINLYPPISSCSCKNRSFELCPYPYRSSNSCMINKLKKCENCEYHYQNPKKYPRVNRWHNLPYNISIVT